MTSAGCRHGLAHRLHKHRSRRSVRALVYRVLLGHNGGGGGHGIETGDGGRIAHFRPQADVCVRRRDRKAVGPLGALRSARCRRRIARSAGPAARRPARVRGIVGSVSMNILFIANSRIGDAVLSTGILGTLLDDHPRAEITIACGPAAAPLFETASRFHRVIVLKQRRGAMHFLDIVCNAFRPRDVREAVKGLLEADSVRDYFREILAALRALDVPGKLERSARTVQNISAALSLNSELEGVTDEKVRSALAQMSNTSRGMVRISGDRILFSGDIEEFARRVSSLTGESGTPRKLGSFRNGEVGQ